MAKKKTVRPKGKKVAGMVLGGLVLLLVAGFVYGKTTGKDLAVRIGETGYGVSFDDETGEADLQTGRFGCCSPQCENMFEIECSAEHGYGGRFYGGSCGEVEECREVCCLPDCKDVPKVWCEGDYGMSGHNWVSSPCSQQDECEMGCCWIGGKAIREQKAPCIATGGQWKKGKCKKGFSVHMEAETSGTSKDVYSMFAGGEGAAMIDAIAGAFGATATVDMKMWIDAYTCKETPYTPWTGSLVSETTVCSERTGCETETDKSPVGLPFDEDGKASITGYAGLAKMSFGGEVNLEQMTYTVDYGIMEPMIFKGKIQKGAPECEEK